MLYIKATEKASLPVKENTLHSPTLCVFINSLYSPKHEVAWLGISVADCQQILNSRGVQYLKAKICYLLAVTTANIDFLKCDSDVI